MYLAALGQVHAVANPTQWDTSAPLLDDLAVVAGAWDSSSASSATVTRHWQTGTLNVNLNSLRGISRVYGGFTTGVNGSQTIHFLPEYASLAPASPSIAGCADLGKWRQLTGVSIGPGQNSVIIAPNSAPPFDSFCGMTLHDCGGFTGIGRWVGWEMYNKVVVVIDATFDVTPDYTTCGPTGTLGDPRGLAPGPKDEGNLVDCLTSKNAFPVSDSPVSLATGVKVESAVDLSLPVTGGSFQLRRELTSDTAYLNDTTGNLVGRGWMADVFRAIRVRQVQQNFEVDMLGPPMHSHLVFRRPSGTGVEWVTAGPTTQKLRQETLNLDNAQIPVWRLTEPGGWSSDFYRQGAGIDAKLEGLLLQSRDAHGNASTYQYFLGGDGARLAVVFVNGTPAGASSDAEIAFTWSTGGTASAGKLKKIEARRRIGNTNQYRTTQKVDYLYAAEVSGLPADVGTDGDLIQVTRSVLVDMSEDQAPTTTAPPVYWKQVTQYRYHDGAAVGTSGDDQRLLITGAVHQLKSVFMPEQIEYYAQQRGLSGDPLLSAASELLTKTDDYSLPSPFTGEKTVDLAAKIISYENNGTTNRVTQQFLQTACGCGGGVAQGVKYEYTYYDYPSGTPTGHTTIITEKTGGSTAGTYPDTYRVTYYDMDLKGADNVPYLVNKAVMAPGQTLPWVWHTEYDSNRNVQKEFMPSATAAYTPYNSSTQQAPTWTPVSSSVAGLAYQYTYNTDNRVTETRVSRADISQFDLVSATTYGSGAIPSYLPVAVNKYRKDNSTTAADVETLTFDYGFHTDTLGLFPVAWIKTSEEAEAVGENGPDGTFDSYELFDTAGRNVWSRRADNSLSYRAFDPHTGLVTQVTRNASRTAPNGDATQSLSPASFAGITGTSGWGRSDGGELTTHTRRDLLGRVIEEIDPPGDNSDTPNRGVSRYTLRQLRQVPEFSGTLAYYAEISLPHELLGATGPSGGGPRFDGPATITWFDAAGKVIRQEQRLLDANATTYSPGSLTYTLLSSSAGTVGKSIVTLNLAGQVKSEKIWDWIDSTTPANDVTNTRSYEYDKLGRLSKTTDFDGTITFNSVFDVLDRVLEIKVGTSDTNALVVTQRSYDTSTISQQGVGDGHLTFVRHSTGEAGSGTQSLGAQYEDTKFTFDNRGRVIQATRFDAAGTTAAPPITASTYDNLDRVTTVSVFDDSAMSHRARFAQTFYSQRGMVYRSELAVNPESLSTTAFLPTNRFFDEAGRVIAEWSPNHSGVKRTFDGLGRVVVEYLTDGGGDAVPGSSSAYSDAKSLSGDTVLEQFEHRYNSVGLEDLTTTAYRTNRTNSGLGGLDTNEIRTFVGTLYDDADRPIRTVDFGTNPTSPVFTTGTQPTWPPAGSVIPNFNTTGFTGFIVEKTSYDSRGLAYETTDSEGKVTRGLFDHRGRAVATIRNYDNLVMAWSPSIGRMVVTGGFTTNESETDQATSVVFDANGNVKFRVAHSPPTSGGAENAQVTEYVYGTSLPTGSPTFTDSLVASNKLLREVHSPDETTGQAGTANQYITKFSYNRLGELRSITDPNQTQRTLSRDTRGRVLIDWARQIPSSSVSTWIKRIETAYDAVGQLSSVQSYDTDTATTPKNAVMFAYTPLGEVDSIFQDHNGLIEQSGGTPLNDTRKVAYSYSRGYPSAGSGGSTYSRIQQLTYPDGTALSYTFGSSGSVDDRISRITDIGLPGFFGSTKVVKYGYVGLAMDAEVNYHAADVQLDRSFSQDGKRRTHGQTSQSEAVYPGWDQFGRLAIDAWVDGTLSAGSNSLPTRPAVIDYSYEYDRASNKTKRVDRRPGVSAVAHKRDWRLSYDGLDRLKTADRGYYNTSNAFQANGGEQWTLDMLGNWGRYAVGTYSYPSETETRTHNMANEILTQDLIPSQTGSVDTLTHDDNGNLTNHPRSSTATDDYKYDAWNRLVKHSVASTSGAKTTIGTYEYNGLSWRTLKRGVSPSNSAQTQQRVMYYDAAWRLIEERVDDEYSASVGTEDDRLTQEYWGIRRLDDAVMRRVHHVDDDSFGAFYYHLTDSRGDTLAITGVGADPQILERVSYSPYGVAAHSWVRDVDGDGDEDGTDRQLIKSSPQVSIGTTGYDPQRDLNRDGSVDSGDLVYFDATAYPRSPLAPGMISDPDGADNVFGFTGGVFNSENGYTLMRHRMYEPALGRFFQRDPIASTTSENSIEYALGNPVAIGDPFGLEPESRAHILSDFNKSRRQLLLAQARGLPAADVERELGRMQDAATLRLVAAEEHVPLWKRDLQAPGAGFTESADRTVQGICELPGRFLDAPLQTMGGIIPGMFENVETGWSDVLDGMGILSTEHLDGPERLRRFGRGVGTLAQFWAFWNVNGVVRPTRPSCPCPSPVSAAESTSPAALVAERLPNGDIRVSHSASPSTNITGRVVKGELQIDMVNVDNALRGQGLYYQMYQRLISEAGNISSISGDMYFTNALVINDLIARGMTPLQAASMSPAAKARAAAGFSSHTYNEASQTLRSTRP